MCKRLFFLLLFATFAVPVCTSAKELGVGLYMGIHRPALEDLNDEEFKSPIAGFATVFSDVVENKVVTLNFKNPLPELELGVNAGLEFQWPLSNDYIFLFGGGTWEASSRAITKGGFYVQGEAANVISERVAKISYNEFYFGLRKNIAGKSKKYKAYYRLTLNEVFDIDYREDLVFLYTSGKADGVKKTIIMQSQATGLLAIQPGFGVEYRPREWLSFAVDASYLIGFKRATLRDGTSNTNFLQTDNLVLWLPQRLNNSTGEVEYLGQNPEPPEADNYTVARLSFDGWKLLFKINLFF